LRCIQSNFKALQAQYLAYEPLLAVINTINSKEESIFFANLINEYFYLLLEKQNSNGINLIVKVISTVKEDLYLLSIYHKIINSYFGRLIK